MKKLLLLALLPAIFVSCSKPHKVKNVERAFYFWKSNAHSLWNEDTILSGTKVKKLYVKFFEVEKNDLMGAVPVAKTTLSINDGKDLVIVPTVYLKNEIFYDRSNASLDSLADNVNFLILKYADSHFYKKNNDVTEYQMDCDWTPKTKNNYFYFLKKLRAISNKQISCTLRLYPYKYPDKMGVPPVDKVMLMCYNLSHPLDNKDNNSILDLDELKSYLDTASKYPLHLDIALPVYSWIQLYQNNKFTAILYGDFDLNNSYKPVKPLWYQVTQDTMADGQFIRKGDMLKYEKIDAVAINQAINLIKKHVELDASTTISLFHLDANQLKKFKHEEISGFYSAFSK